MPFIDEELLRVTKEPKFKPGEEIILLRHKILPEVTFPVEGTVISVDTCANGESSYRLSFNDKSIRDIWVLEEKDIQRKELILKDPTLIMDKFKTRINPALYQYQSDNINQPPHYKSSNAICTQCNNPIECIDVTRHFDFNLGNAIKYIWRAKHKDGLQDLKKAAWYINDTIKQMEKNNANR